MTITRSDFVKGRPSIGDTQPQLSIEALFNPQSPKLTKSAVVKKQHKPSREFSAAFKNAVLPFKTSPVENKHGAMKRLLEIFGKDSGRDVIRYEVSPETIVEETNELLSQIKEQAETGTYSVDKNKDPYSLMQSYKESKDEDLLESLNMFNHAGLSAGAVIEQDSENPLHLAFNSGVDGTPIEIFQFKNYDLAIAAIKGLDADIYDYKDAKASGQADDKLQKMRSNYSEAMIGFIKAALAA